MAVRTLADLLFHVRDVAAGRTDLLSVRLPKGRETLSTSDFVKNVHGLALALERLGIEKGHRVAIFSENRPEWHVVDFACQLLGAATVPLYPSLPAAQLGYILRNSGCRLVFYSDAEKRDLLLEVRASLTTTPELVAFDGDAAIVDGGSITRMMGREAERRGEVPIERFRGRVEADDLASLIYTSGTTGDPKGVMLSHHNLVSNFLACGEIFALGKDDVALSFLPLSHVFQRTVDYLCFHRGVRLRYVPSIERIQAALTEVRPTLLTSVPRLYERAYIRILANVRKESPGRQALFHWAVAVGRRHAEARAHGFVGPFLALRRALADRLVFRRLRERFGGRLRIAISGGAALAREVSELFEAVGLPIYQGYGLTETSPVLAANAPDQHRQGSVGKPLSNVELRVAEDGEILARGPGVMRGYWENPQATGEAVDAEGWLHTGDLGHLDRSGFVFVTDRKKDILVTSGGKNIAPQPIETRLVASPLVTQAVVVGDGYPYPAVLLVPDFDQLAQEVAALPRAQLLEHPATLERFETVLAEVNAGLAEHERLRRFRLLERELTVADGELTPTLKVRRRVVAQRWADAIASMYTKTQKL